MAQFFRKVRKKLFVKNRFTKYFIYAFGEILLVVIGILIALQVNNFNEQRKSNAKEKKHLISMKSELLNNIELVQIEIEELNKSLNGQRELIALINSEKDTISEIELSKILATSFSNVLELKYQDGTFKELLYSGGLISINNDRIKNEIASWEGRMIALKTQEKGVYDLREKIFDYMIENGVLKIMLDNIGVSDRLQMQKSIKRNSSKIILKSQKFENQLSYHIALIRSLNSYYLKLEKDIKSLLQLVEEELNKKE